MTTAWPPAALLILYIGVTPAFLGCGGQSPVTAPLNAETITDEDLTAREVAFSDPPTDDEFLRAAVFDEPLVPVRATSPDENRALAAALRSYREAVRRSGVRDSVESITEFLDARAASAWTPALRLQLGAIYRQTGHFSKALEAWQQAWTLARDLDAPNARAVGDAAVARLSQLEAYLGRKELLTPLLAEIRQRPLRGTAAELVSESSRGLSNMKERPESSFKCGPLALLRIHQYHTAPGGADPRLMEAITAARSTPNGMSLASVSGLSQRIGMRYQMAFRSPGARLVLPAVVHWKVGHYAALVDRVKGRILVADSTFGEDILVTPATLDEEASGYFLLPPGPLPPGWRSVSPDEASRVWGRGNTGDNRDNGDTGPCGGSGPAFPCQGGRCEGSNAGGYTTWNVQPMVVGLSLDDTPVGYSPPIGPPVQFRMYYAHRDAQQPMIFNYTNFGSRWTTTWLSYVTDDLDANQSAVLYGRGGGSETYTFKKDEAASAPAPYTQAVLTWQASRRARSGFSRRLPNGAVEEFNQPLGRKFFLTAVVDPRGNRVTLAYDAMMRLVTITDALGQVTTLSYELIGDPLKVTKVTDPFGRSATFTYTAGGLLASITDVIGITSSYTYGSPTSLEADFVTRLTTPYGTTTFAFGDGRTDPLLGTGRFVTATDPLGRTSRVEFRHPAEGMAWAEPEDNAPQGWENNYLHWRNTFVFSPTQLQAAMSGNGLDYSKAKILHWLHTPDGSSTSRVLESVKDPLENRVWFSYPEQLSTLFEGTSKQPTAIARVLDDGTTRIVRFRYNEAGNVTQYTDPAGREYSFSYDATGIDLLSVSNTTNGRADVLGTWTYDARHLPLRSTDAAGQTTRFEYNAAGQPTRVTDALGRSWSYTYDDRGYVVRIEGPVAGETYVLTYDAVGRVASATDPAGRTVSYSYDNADRPVEARFPDGTSTRLTYHHLDLASSTDRLGRTTRFEYDAGRQLSRITNPLNQVVALDYCQCGALSAITDPRGGRTSFERDLQDRLVAQRYADGSERRFDYERRSGRVHGVTDARGQTTVYSYHADDTLAGIEYQKAAIPTAPVAFTWDPAYRRLASMTDGFGTTRFAYYPVTLSPSSGANRLASVTSPVAGGTETDTVSFAYDALGRVVREEVDGVASTREFDALGRLRVVTNPLDAFAYGYSDATARVASIGSAHGPQVALTYHGPTGDGLLREMSYSGPDRTPLARFNYDYDAEHRATTFSEALLGTRLAGRMGTSSEDLTAGLVKEAVAERPAAPASASRDTRQQAPAPALLLVPALLVASIGLSRTRRSRRWHVTSAGVLVVAQLAAGCDRSMPSPAEPSLVTSYVYDAADRLVAATIAASPAGGSATPSGVSYTYDGSSNLTSIVAGGVTTSLTYNSLNQLTSPGAVHDAGGNLTAIGDARYTWDAANRLVSVARGAVESELSYDGLGRLARIVEKREGKVIADRAYLWCGATRCVERDNTGPGSPISKRYFAEGVEIGGKAYYYVTDRLGSVRQLVDATGQVRARYDYDPYGRQTKTGGDLDSDVTYAGYFHHAPSGLHLAMYRAYHPGLGRWLNRDPIGEAGGLNLYAYVGGDPVNWIDPSGLDPSLVFRKDTLYLVDTSTTGTSTTGISTTGTSTTGISTTGTSTTGTSTISTWPAVSGPFGKGALPPGQYKVHASVDLGAGQAHLSSYTDRKGNSWWTKLEPLFVTTRRGLGIHPDGNTPGTEGCIGITSTNTEDLRDILRGPNRPTLLDVK